MPPHRARLPPVTLPVNSNLSIQNRAKPLVNHRHPAGNVPVAHGVVDWGLLRRPVPEARPFIYHKARRAGKKHTHTVNEPLSVVTKMANTVRPPIDT